MRQKYPVNKMKIRIVINAEIQTLKYNIVIQGFEGILAHNVTLQFVLSDSKSKKKKNRDFNPNLSFNLFITSNDK